MSEVQIQSLPLGWSHARIGDLIGSQGLFVDGDWVESKDQDPQGEVRLIQLADIGDGVFQNKSSRYLTYDKAVELHCSFLKPGDLLIARMPDPLGRACIFPLYAAKYVTVVDVCIVRSGTPYIEHRWLMHTVNSSTFRADINSLQSGSTRKRISRGNLSTLRLPVPPNEEQKRIVAEIEKQFSRLDAAVAALKRVQVNLKRYRAAVLRAACEGRLVPTEAELARQEGRAYEPAATLLQRVLDDRRTQWEAEQLAKLEAQGRLPLNDSWKANRKEAAMPETAYLPDLPLGWQWASVEQVTERIVDCLHSTPNFVSEGELCIDTNCIKPGKIVFEKVRYVDLHTFADRNRRMEPQVNDVLFSREGALLGVAVRIPDKLKICLGQRMMIFRLCEVVLARYYEMVLNSPLFRSQYAKEITGSASPHLNIQAIRKYRIPLPPLAEQKRIVVELERRLSIVEKAGATVATDLIRAEKLRQAIL